MYEIGDWYFHTKRYNLWISKNFSSKKYVFLSYNHPQGYEKIAPYKGHAKNNNVWKFHKNSMLGFYITPIFLYKKNFVSFNSYAEKSFCNGFYVSRIWNPFQDHSNHLLREDINL